MFDDLRYKPWPKPFSIRPVTRTVNRDLRLICIRRWYLRSMSLAGKINFRVFTVPFLPTIEAVAELLIHSLTAQTKSNIRMIGDRFFKTLRILRPWVGEHPVFINISVGAKH